MKLTQKQRLNISPPIDRISAAMIQLGVKCDCPEWTFDVSTFVDHDGESWICPIHGRSQIG